MIYRNTSQRYGLVAILLHWIIALGFLGSYISVYYRQWLTEEQTPENWLALQMHLSFGITIAAFVILRVIWKLTNTTPAALPGTKLEHFAARSVHTILYAVMIIMPITGYMGTSVATEYFMQLNIPKFSDTQLYQVVVEGWLGMTWESFEPPIDWIHKTSGEYFIWVLILIHAGAALYHHFGRRDIVLKRMLSPKWQQP